MTRGREETPAATDDAGPSPDATFVDAHGALRAREVSTDARDGLCAWTRATSGVVALLLVLQIVSGTLLAFYYVPSSEAAHATVIYIENVVEGGSWVRALHFHGSQWLPAALFLHLLQLFWRRAYEQRPVSWLASVILLALVMANSATGYTLPWDARAFFSTRIAAGLAAGLPLVGDTARAWLLGGTDLSTLTLSRFNALHLLVVPFLIIAVLFARLYFARLHLPRTTEDHERLDAGAGGLTTHTAHAPLRSSLTRGGGASQLARNAVAAGVVFLALALVASKWPAPLGPAAGAAGPEYLPRPGAQFLWLFQLLKYFSPAFASLVALLLPAALLGALAALPFLRRTRRADGARDSLRLIGATVFALSAVLVVSLTAIAYLEDTRDPRVREQLARQAQEEDEFRRAPFVPLGVGSIPRTVETPDASAPPSADTVAAPPPPAAYVGNCSKCHGAAGEGKGINPALIGVSERPNRTVEDLVRIIKNPRAYQLEKRMPSFAGKLSDEEMRAVAEWVATLK